MCSRETSGARRAPSPDPSRPNMIQLGVLFTHASLSEDTPTAGEDRPGDIYISARFISYHGRRSLVLDLQPLYKPAIPRHGLAEHHAHAPYPDRTQERKRLPTWPPNNR